MKLDPKRYKTHERGEGGEEGKRSTRLKESLFKDE